MDLVYWVEEPKYPTPSPTQAAISASILISSSEQPQKQALIVNMF
jgi:hypothetical protein